MNTGLVPEASPNVDYKIDVVLRLKNQHNVYPNVEDVEGRPISLSNEIDKFRAHGYPARKLAAIQQLLATKEQEANLLLQRYTNKYGYHPLFRAGLREYFAT